MKVENLSPKDTKNGTVETVLRSMMDFMKDCRVMVERLSWEDLQFHKLSLQNSEMSLVNLQRVAIKEEMKDEENFNYDHLSKDDLIKEVKAKDDRIRELEAKCNVQISKMGKERIRTSLTINKQVDEIERLNRLIKELERRIKDLMEQCGVHQLENDDYVKTEPVENDPGSNGQELTLPIVQGIPCKESTVSECQYVAEVHDTNTVTKITSKKVENEGLITRITSNNLPLRTPLPSNLEVENESAISPDTSTTKSCSPPEPLENNININDDPYRKSQSVSTEGETEDIATRSRKFGGPEFNVEVENHLDANVEIDSLEGALENDLGDKQSRITLTDARKTYDRLSETMKLRLRKRKFADPRSSTVPVCVPKLGRNPSEISELTSISMRSHLPEVPVEVESNSLVSNLETREDVAPKNFEGKFKKKLSTRLKYSTEYKRGVRRRVRMGNEVKPFKCDQCDYASTTKSNLIRHERIHSGEKPFKCDQCDYVSTHKFHLTTHQRIHSGEKPFKCGQCDFVSRNKSHLTTHKRIHSGEKPFKCGQCDYECKDKSNLNTHQRIHSGEKPFKCDQCDFASRRKNDLITHQRIHSGEKPFKCDECDYVSWHKFNLTTHQRIHSGEKPFKCDQCDYASRWKYDLITHQRIHSGEKPFKCDQCDYASTMKTNLIAHQRIHSGEKPFQCDQCDYRFRQKCHVIVHKRNSHMNA